MQPNPIIIALFFDLRISIVAVSWHNMIHTPTHTKKSVVNNKPLYSFGTVRVIVYAINICTNMP